MLQCLHVPHQVSPALQPKSKQLMKTTESRWKSNRNRVTTECPETTVMQIVERGKNQKEILLLKVKGRVNWGLGVKAGLMQCMKQHEPAARMERISHCSTGSGSSGHNLSGVSWRSAYCSGPDEIPVSSLLGCRLDLSAPCLAYFWTTKVGSIALNYFDEHRRETR